MHHANRSRQNEDISSNTFWFSVTRKVEDWQNDIMPKQTTHLTLFIFRRITHRYRNRARCKKRIHLGLVSDHPARNTNAGCRPNLFRWRRVRSGFVQSKRIRHNASISEPGQMYKNGSDSDRSMTIRPGVEMLDVVSICTITDPIMMIRATSRTRRKKKPIRIRIVCGSIMYTG